MNSGDDEDHLDYWIKTFRRANGYASEFERRDAVDKAIVELNTANEWSLSMRAVFGVRLGAATNNPSDPPDVYFRSNARSIGVELSELVEGSHKARAVGGESRNHGRLFRESQWSQDRFRTEVQQRIDAKGRKCGRKGIIADALLIHTAEPWLSYDDAKEWVKAAPLEPHPHISNAFIIFRYEGSGSDHWPVVKLYGEMGT